MRIQQFIRFIALVIISVSCLTANALDLPIKKVNGRQFYVYKVKKHETIFGVSKNLGLSREEIIRHNPSAANGLSKGMTLYFPFEEYAVAAPPDAESVSMETEVISDTVAEDVVPSIAVILPFGLGEADQSRQNKLALDFYRGFLIAADSLSNRPGELNINVYDCGNSVSELKKMLENTSAIAQASVIIGPENEDMLSVIEDHAATAQTYVLNMLNVRDSSYLTNPYVIQANIPQKEMYTLAIKAFMDMYEGYKPVILRNEKGRNEKEPFVEALTEDLIKRGVEPMRINYSGTLLVGDMDGLDQASGGKFVVIPSSGALSEFNKFALVVKALRDRASQIPATFEEGEAVLQVELFGYPDWTAFRGEALDLLQRLNAKVYSRFFDNFLGFDSRIISDDFRFWYGTDMIESIPSQGLLGYDTGNYLIRNIRANEGRFNPEWNILYQGVQSVFRFDKISEGGYYNNALYIVEFLPEGRMTKRIIY